MASLINLIGYQLVSIDDTKIVVRKGNSTYELLIEDDNGDCCGYNDFNTKLLISETELERNPVITNVEVEEDEDDGMSAKVTFFGEYKPVAELNSFSFSGSGWCYGACVSIVCKELDMDEIITQW